MKLAVIAVSVDGVELARKIQCSYPYVPIFAPAALVKSEQSSDLRRFEGGLQDFIGTIFHRFEALVLVMATGIAVRVTAPYLKGKAMDPAVVVVDDGGRFAISLLSGHLGGANELAHKLGEALGALPVITTSTDRHGVLAFDLLARRWGWVLENLTNLKKISTAQIRGEPLLIYTDDAFQFHLPGNIKTAHSQEEIYALCEENDQVTGVVFITNRKTLPRLPQELPYITLRPRNIVAGVGCRKGVSAARVLSGLGRALEEAGRVEDSLSLLATVEVKKNEPGLLLATQKLAVPLRLITLEQIREVEKRFEASSFVQKQIGVSAVAEPCAYLGSGNGRLILNKRSYNGVTVALGEAFVRLDNPWESNC